MNINIMQDLSMIPSLEITLSKDDLVELIDKKEVTLYLGKKGKFSQDFNDLGDTIRHWRIKLEKDASIV